MKSRSNQTTSAEIEKLVKKINNDIKYFFDNDQPVTTFLKNRVEKSEILIDTRRDLKDIVLRLNDSKKWEQSDDVSHIFYEKLTEREKYYNDIGLEMPVNWKTLYIVHRDKFYIVEHYEVKKTENCTILEKGKRIELIEEFRGCSIGTIMNKKKLENLYDKKEHHLNIEALVDVEIQNVIELYRRNNENVMFSIVKHINDAIDKNIEEYYANKK